MTARHMLAGSLLVLTMAGCKQTAQAPQTKQLTLHEVMAEKVDPTADVIWSQASKSYGDDGNAQAGILMQPDWDAIAHAGRDLHDGASVIIQNPDLKVVRPHMTILDEGKIPAAITSVQVETYLDRDRGGLAKHAQELSSIALQIEAAAKARDVTRTVKLSEDLDGVCESCHKEFWYPDQKTPLAAIKRP